MLALPDNKNCICAISVPDAVFVAYICLKIIFEKDFVNAREKSKQIAPPSSSKLIDLCIICDIFNPVKFILWSKLIKKIKKVLEIIYNMGYNQNTKTIKKKQTMKDADFDDFYIKLSNHKWSISMLDYFGSSLLGACEVFHYYIPALQYEVWHILRIILRVRNK